MTNANLVPVMAQYPNGVPLLVALSQGWCSANTDVTGAIQGNSAGGVNSILAAAATGQLGLGTGYANAATTAQGGSPPINGVPLTPGPLSITAEAQQQVTPATVAAVLTYNGN